MSVGVPDGLQFFLQVYNEFFHDVENRGKIWYNTLIEACLRGFGQFYRCFVPESFLPSQYCIIFLGSVADGNSKNKESNI